jgi:hypothetical protein
LVGARDRVYFGTHQVGYFSSNEEVMKHQTGPITIVVSGRVFEVDPDMTGAPQSMTVTVRAEAQMEWTFEEPGWRSLGYGLGSDVFYFWSARRVIAFPLANPKDPDLISIDEDDIIAPFQVSGRWAVVCESSVRLLDVTGEVDRIELREVVLQARLDGGTLVLTDLNGIRLRVELGATKLRVVD